MGERYYTYNEEVEREDARWGDQGPVLEEDVVPASARVPWGSTPAWAAMAPSATESVVNRREVCDCDGCLFFGTCKAVAS